MKQLITLVSVCQFSVIFACSFRHIFSEHQWRCERIVVGWWEVWVDGSGVVGGDGSTGGGWKWWVRQYIHGNRILRDREKSQWLQWLVQGREPGFKFWACWRLPLQQAEGSGGSFKSTVMCPSREKFEDRSMCFNTMVFSRSAPNRSKFEKRLSFFNE